MSLIERIDLENTQRKRKRARAKERNVCAMTLLKNQFHACALVGSGAKTKNKKKKKKKKKKFSSFCPLVVEGNTMCFRQETDDENEDVYMIVSSSKTSARFSSSSSSFRCFSRCCCCCRLWCFPGLLSFYFSIELID